MSPHERKARLAYIWKNTHRDYKGTTGGERTILVLRHGGTVLVGLNDLTASEVRKLSKRWSLKRTGYTGPGPKKDGPTVATDRTALRRAVRRDT